MICIHIHVLCVLHTARKSTRDPCFSPRTGRGTDNINLKKKRNNEKRVTAKFAHCQLRCFDDVLNALFFNV